MQERPGPLRCAGALVRTLKALGFPAVNIDLNGCTSGDPLAWETFVKQTAGIIYAAAQRCMRGGGLQQRELEDRVQDVYVRLVQNNFRLLKTYDSRRASLSTWLTLVTRSLVREHLQKRSLHVVALESYDAPIKSEKPTVNGDVPLHLLTERQRIVLDMLFQQGMSVEEAARRLDVDPQTIRSTKHKALIRLRQEMPDGPARGDLPGNLPGDVPGDVPATDHL